jgi:hypothetical protein
MTEDSVGPLRSRLPYESTPTLQDSFQPDMCNELRSPTVNSVAHRTNFGYALGIPSISSSEKSINSCIIFFLLFTLHLKVLCITITMIDNSGKQQVCRANKVSRVTEIINN